MLIISQRLHPLSLWITLFYVQIDSILVVCRTNVMYYSALCMVPWYMTTYQSMSHLSASQCHICQTFTFWIIGPSHEAAINGSKRGQEGITSEAKFLS